MTKALKELCVVILLGAGILFLMWGLLNQVNTAAASRPPVLVSRIAWNAVWTGASIIVASIALAVFVKPAK
jgi:Na+/H+ antiporter NhaC